MRFCQPTKVRERAGNALCSAGAAWGGALRRAVAQGVVRRRGRQFLGCPRGDDAEDKVMAAGVAQRTSPALPELDPNENRSRRRSGSRLFRDIAGDLMSNGRAGLTGAREGREDEVLGWKLLADDGVRYSRYIVLTWKVKKNTETRR